MAYRDQFKGVNTNKKEQVPRPAQDGNGDSQPFPPPPSGLEQDSMKGANVLVADLIPGDNEHSSSRSSSSSTSDAA